MNVEHASKSARDTSGRPTDVELEAIGRNEGDEGRAFHRWVEIIHGHLRRYLRVAGAGQISKETCVAK